MVKSKKLGVKSTLSKIWAVIIWFTGVIVSLAVGFGLTSGNLKVPLLSSIIVESAGWIVIILTLIGVSLALIDKLSG